MHLVDKVGMMYSMTADYAGDQIIGGPLKNNEVFTADIDFNLPESSTPQDFIFQLDDKSDIQTATIN
jgi:hypothetical protein